ncbi:MAG TPA: MaoC/PaaZ C-terminal domain-containing protein [Telluria sp.]|nr:MaoC/PaaZ C-terminal domain-containing protein [Telluria sp.]
MAEPLPAAGALAMARALFKRPRPAASAPFSTTYTLDGIDAAHLARYNRLLGFAVDAVPVTYYYLLAQRAHLPTLLRDEFPFRVAGLVHVSNEIVEHRRPELAASLRLVTDVQLEAPRANGAVYCALVTRCFNASAPVFTCTSTYLAVRGKGRGARPAADAAPGPRIGTWQLDAASGRAYAAVSGDWNPIHLWRWSARLFGMRQPIIHGMHTMGKACALLEQADGRRVRAIGGRFKAPALLGSQLALHADVAQSRYAVLASERVVLEGTVAF